MDRYKRALNADETLVAHSIVPPLLADVVAAAREIMVAQCLARGLTAVPQERIDELLAGSFSEVLPDRPRRHNEP